MENRLIPLLGAVALGAGALTLAQDDPVNPAPEVEEAQPNGPEQGAAAAGEEADPLVAARALVLRLADESYEVREAATKELWELAEAGLQALREGEKSDDPEVAYRARIVLRRILTGITPETSPEVVALVQRYFRSDRKGKKDIFDKLLEERAFIQMVRLYHFEEDNEARAACYELANKAVVNAVMASLVNERLDEGESLLRIAPKSDENWRRLAAFLRVRGKLEAELAATEGKIVFDLDGHVANPASLEIAGLRLALLRSQGKVTEARDLAQKMGREDVVAGLALLEGDPVPYLSWYMNQEDESPIVRVHAETVIKRWQGDEAGAARLMNNMAKLAAGDGDEKREARLSLLLNGYLDLVLPLDEQENKEAAFGYYEATEQPLKALEVLGYAGDAEAKKEWVAKRLKAVREDWAEARDPREEIMDVSAFLHSRGERAEAEKLVQMLAAAAAEEGASTFFEYLGRLSAQGHYEIAFFMAGERLGENDENKEAGKALEALFGGEGDTAQRMWKRLAELEPKVGARLRLLGALYGTLYMEDGELQAKLAQLLEAAGKEEPASRVQAYTELLGAAEARDDAGTALLLLHKLAELAPADEWSKRLANHYVYASDWDRAVGEIEKIIEKEPKNWHYLALYGGAKIRVGEPEKAAEAFKEVELIVLDEPVRLRALCEAVESTGAVMKAHDYWRQLLVVSPAGEFYWRNSAHYLAKHALFKKQWRLAAALTEVDAMQYIKANSEFSPATYIRKRFAADFYRGLALHQEGDEENARKLFGRSFELLNGDASLADEYFPLLREVGLVELHDRNFKEIYERVQASIKAFPNAHNTYNSAAWLASRASRELDDALEKASTALRLRPRQAAYLDTMAEVWFAKNDREKAVEWSHKAMNNSFNGGYAGAEGGVGLREQYDRFRFGDFPVP